MIRLHHADIVGGKDEHQECQERMVVERRLVQCFVQGGGAHRADQLDALPGDRWPRAAGRLRRDRGALAAPGLGLEPGGDGPARAPLAIEDLEAVLGRLDDRRLQDADVSNGTQL